MKTIKGLTVDEIVVVDKVRNIFEGRNHDTGFVFTVRQPNKLDTRNHKKAWRRLSLDTLRLYVRQYCPKKFYDSKYRCTRPRFRGGVGEEDGFLPLIMEIDDKIVGFGDFMFMKGTHYKTHDIPDEDVGCSMNLCVIDKYHGLGIGTYYSFISTYIAKYFKADWTVGFTLRQGGMVNIRARQGWETVKLYGKYAAIRKRL